MTWTWPRLPRETKLPDLVLDLNNRLRNLGAELLSLPQSPYGATMGWTVAEELVTLNTGGTTTDTSASLLPANSLLLGVTATVVTTITTASTWSVGDGTTAARFVNAHSTLTAGTQVVGLLHLAGNVSTTAAGPTQASAVAVRITTDVNPGAGKIRVAVFALTFGAATS